MKTREDRHWSSMADFSAAVKQTSETGIVDPRLVPIDGANDSVFSEAELTTLEQVADDLDSEAQP